MGDLVTFVQFLEELASAEQTIKVPTEEVERLAGRFGDRVRHMGRWNAAGDGSLDIPMGVIREAASELDGQSLNKAVEELKTEQFSRMLEASSAISLIEKVTEAYHRHFRELMSRYQSTSDQAEGARLRDQLVQEIFGQ